MTVIASGPRVYLAGPDVFLANASEVAEAKKAICADVGLVGVFPLDNAPPPDDLTGPALADWIAQANERLMRGCDAIIANCTPFRGTGMDGGTAFEIGFMRALGRPCFCYSNCAAPYADRVRAYRAGRAGVPFDGDLADTEIEDFGLAENLMITQAVRVGGGGHDVVLPDAGGDGGALDALGAFRRCVQQLRGALGATSVKHMNAPS